MKEDKNIMATIPNNYLNKLLKYEELVCDLVSNEKLDQEVVDNYLSGREE